MTLKDFRDGMLIGTMFGVIASATFVVIWWAMDAILARVDPALVVAWTGIGSAVVAGVLSALGGDR